MKFRALADRADGSGLGRGDVTRSILRGVVGAGFAMQKRGSALTAGQDSLAVSSWWVFVPPPRAVLTLSSNAHGCFEIDC